MGARVAIAMISGSTSYYKFIAWQIQLDLTVDDCGLEQALSNRSVQSFVSSVSFSIPTATFGLVML